MRLLVVTNCQAQAALPLCCSRNGHGSARGCSRRGERDASVGAGPSCPVAAQSRILSFPGQQRQLCPTLPAKRTRTHAHTQCTHTHAHTHNAHTRTQAHTQCTRTQHIHNVHAQTTHTHAHASTHACAHTTHTRTHTHAHARSPPPPRVGSAAGHAGGDRWAVIGAELTRG